MGGPSLRSLNFILNEMGNFFIVGNELQGHSYFESDLEQRKNRFTPRKVRVDV